ADADVHNSHRFAAAEPEPMRNDQLMRDRAGENIADGINNPKSVVNSECSAHVGEAGERDAGEHRSNQDQLARAEAMDDHGAKPDGESSGEREAERDVGARPLELALEIVVEESD